MTDKVKTVAEVIQTVPDGSHIALGGFAINRCNIVVAHELIRQRKKNLTLSQGVVGLDTDLLVGQGLVSRLIMGGGSLDRFGPVHCVNRARETRSVAPNTFGAIPNRPSFPRTVSKASSTSRMEPIRPPCFNAMTTMRIT